MYFRANRRRGNDVSLNDTLGIDKDGNEIYLIDVIPGEQEDVDVLIQKNNNIKLLFKYLNVLSERERKIITLRYGLNNNDVFTQKEISTMMKISRSYVSRLEKRALLNLYRECFKHNKKDL